MKVTEVEIMVKTGLPNYSSRETRVKAVADENESLEVVAVVQELKGRISMAWTNQPQPETHPQTTVTATNGQTVQSNASQNAFDDIL